MKTTEYPTINNCNLSTRTDEVGQLVYQALQWADADRFDRHDRDERAVLDALESMEALLSEGSGERDDAASLSACAAAEQTVATMLRETRQWFLDAYRGERLDSPYVGAAFGRIDWRSFPAIDGDLRLTGECVDADDDTNGWLSYRGDAFISRADAVSGGWTIDDEDGTAEPPVA